MAPRQNPYTTNAGAEPAAIVGCDNLLERFDVLLHRMSAGRTEQSMIITGLHGVGKTVLLSRFYKVALERSWAVIDEEVSKHDDTDFRRIPELTIYLAQQPDRTLRARAQQESQEAFESIEHAMHFGGPEKTDADGDSTSDPALTDEPGRDWSDEGGATANGPATDTENGIDD